MNNKILVGVVVAFVVILLGTSIYKNRQNEQPVNNDRQIAIDQEVQHPVETVNAKYQYKNGKNIFVVSLILPSPCHTYNSNVEEKDGLFIINLVTAPTQEICAQVLTERLIKIEKVGNQDDVYIAKLNGEVVNLNLFTLPATDDIDTIEIFMKG